MVLPDIPAELTLNIAEFLDPITAFNFAITNKVHWDLFRPIVEKHAGLFRKYGFVGYRGDGDDSTTQVLWDLMEELLQNPNLACYVRELNIHDEWRSCWDLNHYDPIPPEDLVDRLRATAVDKFSNYDDSSLGKYVLDKVYPRFMQRLRRGYEEPLVVLLVHCLSHLRTFRLTYRSSGWNILFPLFSRMTTTTLSSPTFPFQNLTTASVAWTNDLGSGIGWCHFFICLPSLRSFVAFRMGGVDDCEEDESEKDEDYFEAEDNDSSGYPTNWLCRIRDFKTVYGRSNVKQLFFAKSQLDVEAMETIMRCISNLERFSYESGGVEVTGCLRDSDWTCPKRLIKVLADYTRHSLKELVLEWGHDKWDEMNLCDDYLVSLRSFKTLTTLRCPWVMLFPNLHAKEIHEDYEIKKLVKEDFPGFDLRRILPASLKALHLQTAPYDDLEPFRHQEFPPDAPFERVLQPSPLSPNLKQVYIEWWTDEKRKAHWTEAMDTMTPLPSMENNPLSRLYEGHGY